MKEIHVKPEKAQRTVWFIHWSLVFFPVFVPCFILIFIVNELVFAICAAAWVVFMLPFLFWIPAYFRSLKYSITADVVRGQKGVFWKRFATVPYHKITNVDITQGPLQRKYDVGTIHCQTAGAGGQQGAGPQPGIAPLDEKFQRIFQVLNLQSEQFPSVADGLIGVFPVEYG